METTRRPHSRRHERTVVLVVGGLSVVTGALYLWTLHAAVASGDAGPVTIPAHVAFVAVNTASTGLLWWHRRHPVRVFAAILCLYVASAIAIGYAGNGGLTLPLWFSVFALTAYAPLGRALPAIAVGWIAGTAVKVQSALTAGYPVTAPEAGLAFAADVGYFYLACGALGAGFRFQHQRASEAAERVRLVEERSRAVHAEAVATERNRLARDLHDLAAHELMDVLLSVRALQVTSDDPALPGVEQKTACALDNMRAVVRTLRHDDRADPERLPLPDAAARLVDTLRTERDITVDSTIRVSEPVDDAVASTVLSVLQEAVLNAARHAPGRPVVVSLGADGSGVRLTASNRTAPSRVKEREGTGYGLIGAAERARLLGGSLDAGPAPNGDWIVRLRIPHLGEPSEPMLAEEAS